MTRTDENVAAVDAGAVDNGALHAPNANGGLTAVDTEAADTAAMDTGDVAGLKAGATHQKQKWGTAQVKNAEGKARSHITLRGRWDVPPEVLFHIFTYPDNTALFRDVSRVGQRNVITTAPGFKVVEVEQHQELRILWMNRTFTTWLKVTEDCRDQECLSVQFDLVKSDVLSQFAGRWELRPTRDAQGAVVGCEAELNQDVLPKGLPPIVQHLPGVGELLRSVCMRAIQRVMEDMDAAIVKIKAGMSKGRAPLDVLRELCGSYQEQGHANGAVTSFEVNGSEDDEDDEDDKKQPGSVGPVPQQAAATETGQAEAGSRQGSAEGGQPASEGPQAESLGRDQAHKQQHVQRQEKSGVQAEGVDSKPDAAADALEQLTVSAKA